MAAAVNDPLFPTQWGLSNREQAGGNPGIDVNALPVWPDYTGRGIRVGVVDEGVQLDHPDLAANVDLAASWDGQFDVPGGGPTGPRESHGTAVAGIIAAAANNGLGGAGVAPDATLIAYHIPLGNTPSKAGNSADAAAAVVFTKALESGVDVINNSWGSSAAFGNNYRDAVPNPVQAPLVALGTSGRGGKGAVIVTANGNDRAPGFDGGLDNFTNNRFTITVAAIDTNGVASSYSTPGSNLLVSAPGGGSVDQVPTMPGNAITTTDRTGSLGYNQTSGTGGDYTFNFNGTSAATPFVSGVAALMLQANPDLGYRDVQQILAYTARQTDPSASSWTLTHASDVNGGGAHFSRDYGFGLVDARAAVRLAESYRALGAASQDESNLALLDSPAASGSAALLPDTVTSIQFSMAAGVVVNHLDLTLDLTTSTTSELVAYLTSPSGTTVVLFAAAQNPSAVTPDEEDQPSPQPWPSGGFTLGTDAFWGEQSSGTWTLNIRAFGDVSAGATFNTATLQVGGQADTGAHQYIYTDEFAAAAARDPSRLTLAVAEGSQILNAAAVSSDVTVDVRGGHAVIAGQGVTIAGAAGLTAIASGDGDDTLIGGDADTRFMAGRGTNTIQGGAGSNTALLTDARADYWLGLSGGNITVTGLDGSTVDTLSGVQSLGFSDSTVDLGAALEGRIAAGGTGAGFGHAYDGPVSYLQWEFLADTSQSLVLSAALPNTFLRGGGSSDALIALGGDNVLDGGGGSNWLVGGSGMDIFFVDTLLDTSSPLSWDTIQNFDAGDMLTVWGFDGSAGAYAWADNQGAAGHEGATLTLSNSTGVAALVTLDGLSSMTASLSVNTGSAGSLSYLTVTRLA